MSPSALVQQLPFALRHTQLSELGDKYEGKVRDTYRRGDRLVLVTTDRLSAFDRVLTTIPFKGQVLNQLAQFWFDKTKHIAPNHLLDVPDPNVAVARACEPLPIEMVIRGHLTGSLWRDYQKGAHSAYGIELSPGLRKDEPLAFPLITPSTKAPKGEHDQPISQAEILGRGMLTRRDWERACEIAQALFAEGQRQAASRGLILVDTKYELGKVGDTLYVIDELHTPDSSRYWIAEGSQERFIRGEEQRMLDKENIRQWLIQERAFIGHGEPPEIPDRVRVELAEKYLAAYERITGLPLSLRVGDPTPRIEANLRQAGYFGPASR